MCGSGDRLGNPGTIFHALKALLEVALHQKGFIPRCHEFLPAAIRLAITGSVCLLVARAEGV